MPPFYLKYKFFIRETSSISWLYRCGKSKPIGYIRDNPKMLLFKTTAVPKK